MIQNGLFSWIREVFMSKFNRIQQLLDPYQLQPAYARIPRPDLERAHRP